MGVDHVVGGYEEWVPRSLTASTLSRDILTTTNCAAARSIGIIQIRRRLPDAYVWTFQNVYEPYHLAVG